MPAGPTLNLYPDGAHYYLGDDMAANIEETKRFSAADARALPAFEDAPVRTGPGRAAGLQLDGARPADAIARTICASSRGGGGSGSGSASSSPISRSCSRRSATQLLSERFTDDHVKAAMGWHAINDSVAGPSTPGTALRAAARPRERGGRRRRPAVGVRAGRHGRAHRDDGRRRSRGGLRDPVRCRGRARSSRRGGRAVGRAARRRRGAPRGAACSRTPTPSARSCRCAIAPTCPPSSSRRIEAYRCMGTSIKINLAVSELPYVTRPCPRAACSRTTPGSWR